jgi:hypothetical protein
MRAHAAYSARRFATRALTGVGGSDGSRRLQISASLPCEAGRRQERIQSVLHSNAAVQAPANVGEHHDPIKFLDA